MRILLAANASYVPPRGGATRSNLAWLDYLASRGHECRVVAAALAQDPGKQRQMDAEEIPAEILFSDGVVEVVRRGSLTVHSSSDPGRQTQLLQEQIQQFQPDWVLVSSEDLGHALLAEASRAAPGRVVYLAHTPQFFPFGPESWNPQLHATELVRRAAAVVAIGEHMAGYIRQHTGCSAAVIHPPIYGPGPFARQPQAADGLITMINPCAIKGLGIFLALADRFPQVRFGALPGWGTTSADLQELRSRTNIVLLSNCRDIGQVLRRTRILLMPSLWYEGFGLIVVEAMLRGIPVIASNSGGLAEAKLGTGFVVPVTPVVEYQAVFDERGLPRPIVPESDLGPWEQALSTLLTDRAAYEQEAESSHQAAVRFVSGLEPGRMETFLSELSPAKMRILLAQNSPYYPAHGGGDKSNRLLLEALAQRGHICRVVARTAALGPEEQIRYMDELARRSIEPQSTRDGVVISRLHGVEVHVLANNPHLRQYFAGQLSAFQPDVVIHSTDDPAQLLLEASLRDGRARLAYLARATLALPFGPDCAFPSAEKTERLRQVHGVVGVSRYVAGYIRQHGGIEAVALPISLLEPGPYPDLGRFDNEYVTMVNPCAVKGISIFVALAARMPDVSFAAVPTWGTLESDLAILRQHPNIHILNPVDDIDEILARTRVLLVPSLWAEARSRIVVEAMLRGIPVIASSVGGIPEAKMGVDYLLPVRPIERYDPTLDEQMVPVARVPEQDIAPWYEALRRLTSDRPHYEAVSRASREAALSYAENLSVVPFESFLRDLLRRPQRMEASVACAQQPPDTHSALKDLSPERRKLLALRLRKRPAHTASVEADLWFPSASAAGPDQVRLFCFPHAGGGTSAFRGWAQMMPACFAMCAARLPGRESRSGEHPVDSMEALVESLARALAPYTGQPFAFFGHSMGAIVAFELARHLRRLHQPLPGALLVSGARAPQYRLRHVPPPEPTDRQLLDELQRLQGIPSDWLRNEELMRVVLPALRADTRIYRNYIYAAEPPLPCPIRVYGGAEDLHITLEHLEAWRAQTTASFNLRLFPGGHFFVETARPQFLQVLARDAGELLISVRSV